MSSNVVLSAFSEYQAGRGQDLKELVSIMIQIVPLFPQGSVIKIPAKDEFVCKIKNAEGNAKTRLKKLDSDSRNTGGLVSVLNLAIGSKVMLRRNISIREKLVNGSMGVVSHFTHDVKGAVTQINVLFDGSKKPIQSKCQLQKYCCFHRPMFTGVSFHYAPQVPGPVVRLCHG